MSPTSLSEMSSNPIDCDFLTSGGTKLRFGSYWRWHGSDAEPPWYFRLEKIQDSAGGLHAVIFTQEGRTVGVHLDMFDSDQITEITDEDELALVLLAML